MGVGAVLVVGTMLTVVREMAHRVASARFASGLAKS